MTERRRFTMLDGMILIAGLAVGFAGVRAEFGVEGLRAERWLAEIHMAAGNFLMLASILVLAWRLRRPRPSIRRIARQPGSAACFAMICFGLFYDANSLVREAMEGQLSWSWPRGSRLWYLLQEFEYEDACLVAVVWIIFALGRIGRPEPSWIDRSGRFVGWSWIAWGIGGAFL